MDKIRKPSFKVSTFLLGQQTLLRIINIRHQGIHRDSFAFSVTPVFNTATQYTYLTQ
jgi:hypothetical protein